MRFILALGGLVLSICIQTSAQEDELTSIEDLASKNYIPRYNNWEYPYFFLLKKYEKNDAETESKSYPVMGIPVSLSNPILNIINKANKFYRMIRTKPKNLDPSLSKQHLME